MPDLWDIDREFYLCTRGHLTVIPKRGCKCKKPFVLMALVEGGGVGPQLHITSKPRVQKRKRGGSRVIRRGTYSPWNLEEWISLERRA